MNRMVGLLGGAIVAAGLSVGAYAHEGHDHEEGKVTTIQGELVDTACFVTSNGEEKGADHAKCAAKCMKSGIPAGLLPLGKKTSDLTYLLTNPVPLAPYAGQIVKVEGVAHDDSHAIDVKHVFVKQGNGWKEVPLQDAHHKPASAAGTPSGREHAR